MSPWILPHPTLLENLTSQKPAYGSSYKCNFLHRSHAFSASEFRLSIARSDLSPHLILSHLSYPILLKSTPFLTRVLAQMTGRGSWNMGPEKAHHPFTGACRSHKMDYTCVPGTWLSPRIYITGVKSSIFWMNNGNGKVENASLCKKNSVIEFVLSLMCTVLQKEVAKISLC
jgi:hypothetical protein